MNNIVISRMLSDFLYSVRLAVSKFKLFYIFSDDIVYNQSMVGSNTMDKRRPDLRDELGYIAPPNRKLPPVPGSNYNTCDRIKRGTAISKRLKRSKIANPMCPQSWLAHAINARHVFLVRKIMLTFITVLSVLYLFMFYHEYNKIYFYCYRYLDML